MVGEKGETIPWEIDPPSDDISTTESRSMSGAVLKRMHFHMYTRRITKEIPDMSW